MRIMLHNPTAAQEQHSKEMLLQLLQEVGYDPCYQSTDEDDFPRALSEPGELVAITQCLASGEIAREKKFSVNSPFHQQR